MKKRFNLVIFNPDSYRGDVLGHLGNAGAVTPNLDELVRKGGVSYANAFAQSPVCTPSRCSFMTGWYPHVHGHRSMNNMLKPHEPNLFTVLRREGYSIWWGGKNDLFSVEKRDDYRKHCSVKYAPADVPEEFFLPPPLAGEDPRNGVSFRGVLRRQGSGPRYRDGDAANTQGAVDFIASTRDDDPPFCLYLPLNAPHPPYLAEEDFYAAIDPARLPPRIPVPERDLPVLNDLRKAYGTERIDEEAWRDLRRVYYAMCSKIDHLFGRVVEALETRGLYDDTLIVFLSDHGDFAGDYGLPEKTHLSLQDALIRVPFLIKPPAGASVRAGIRTHLTELVDMTATLYDLLGVDPGYDAFGRSLRASLAGDDRELREAVFAEVGARKNETSFQNAEVHALPPTSFYGVQSRATRPAHLAGSYAVSCRTQAFKYVRRGYVDQHELYDVRADPGELENLHGRKEVAGEERRMERRLLDFFMTTGDVLPRRQDSRKV